MLQLRQAVPFDVTSAGANRRDQASRRQAFAGACGSALAFRLSLSVGSGTLKAVTGFCSDSCAGILWSMKRCAAWQRSLSALGFEAGDTWGQLLYA